MVTELVTFKMERSFLKEVDLVVKEMNYQNRTEFIRNAIREKMEDARKKRMLEALTRLRGSVKKKTSDKELHRIREEVAQEMFREAKQHLLVSGQGRRRIGAESPYRE